MKMGVGISHRILTAGFCFNPVASYLIDFFPDFLLNDPEKNPEMFLYPYKHITIDFLVFVYQMENRLYLLNEAEKKRMLYGEFANWVVNRTFQDNDTMEREKYSLVGGHLNWPFIRDNQFKNVKKKRDWLNGKFKFVTPL
jgi:hypothetical protein